MMEWIVCWVDDDGVEHEQIISGSANVRNVWDEARALVPAKIEVWTLQQRTWAEAEREGTTPQRNDT